MISGGYRFGLVFLWLPDVRLALERVADRVRRGGHGIPPETIRSRYSRGLRNFFTLYRPMASTWQLYDNSERIPVLVATGDCEEPPRVFHRRRWEAVVKGAGAEDDVR